MLAKSQAQRYQVIYLGNADNPWVTAWAIMLYASHQVALTGASASAP